MADYAKIAEKFIRESELIFHGQSYEILSVTIHPSDDFFYRKSLNLGHLEWYFHKDEKNRQSMQYIDLQFHERFESYRIRLNSIRHKNNGYTETGAGHVFNHILVGQNFAVDYNYKAMSKENTPKLYIEKRAEIYKDFVYLLPRLMSGPIKSCKEVREIYWRLKPFMAIKSFDDIDKHKDYPHYVLISLHFYAYFYKKLGKEYPQQLLDLESLASYREIAINASKQYEHLADAFESYKHANRKHHKSLLAEAFGIELKNNK